MADDGRLDAALDDCSVSIVFLNLVCLGTAATEDLFAVRSLAARVFINMCDLVSTAVLPLTVDSLS